MKKPPFKPIQNTVSKPSSGRGGARAGSGPPRTHVRLEIGEDLYKSLKQYCDLREYICSDRRSPEEFLEIYCRDRLDSPSFLKELERLKVAKALIDAGEKVGMEDL